MCIRSATIAAMEELVSPKIIAASGFSRYTSDDGAHLRSVDIKEVIGLSQFKVIEEHFVELWVAVSCRSTQL
jgi:hypothetical protein